MITGTKAGTLHTRSALLGAQQPSHSLPEQQAGEFGTSSPQPPLLPQPRGQQDGGSAGPSPSRPCSRRHFPAGLLPSRHSTCPTRKGHRNCFPTTGSPSQPAPEDCCCHHQEACSSCQASSGRLRLEQPSAQQGPSWEQPPTLSYHQHLSFSPRTHVVLPGTTAASLRGQAPSQGTVQANSRAVLARAIPQTPLLCTRQ